MADTTTDQPTPEGEVLLISAVLEPTTQFDPKQMQLRFEVGGPYEAPGKEYMDMVNELAATCQGVVERMLAPEAMAALINETGMMLGGQATLFSLSFMAIGGTGRDCTFSIETAVHPDFAVAQDRLIVRVVEECKEAALPVFTRRYPDCTP